jgi:hypothetical protein
VANQLEKRKKKFREKNLEKKCQLLYALPENAANAIKKDAIKVKQLVL